MAIGTHWYAGGPKNVTNVLARRVSCKVIAVEGQNLTDSNKYLHIFDSDVLPPNGSVPLYSYEIAKRLLIAKTLPGPTPEIGRRMDRGVVVAWSSTSETLTLVVAVVGPIYVNGQDLASGGA
jgi:hypothetical protein